LTLGERIRLRRRSLGLDQVEFGNALGVSQSAISSWEKDRGRPGREKLRLLSDLTRDAKFISRETLLGLPDNDKPEPFTYVGPKELISMLRRTRHVLAGCYDSSEDNKNNPAMQNIGNTISDVDRLLLRTTKSNGNRELKKDVG
jgi:transcriptional regulator with XRE-family HTH domain